MKLNRIIIPIIISLLVLPIVSFASETNGTISSVNKYAWSNQAGWVNFKTTNGDVKISDSGITGYVWNSNYGWINMSPTSSGVKIAPNGSMTGYAWGENIGWVNFSGVSINSSGKFVGSAVGKVIGTLTFDCSNCNVSTDYRPKNFRASTQTQSNSYTGALSPVIIQTPVTQTNVTGVKPPQFIRPIRNLNKKPSTNNTSKNNIPKNVKDNVLPAQLFDIRLLLDSSSVTKSENIVTRVTFVSFGRVPTPVSLLFSVIDKNGKTVWKNSASTTVQTEGVYTKRLPVLNLAVGNYKLKLHTKYSKTVEDDFSVPFQIISEKESFNWLTWSIGILVVLIFLIFVIKSIRDKITRDGVVKGLKIP